MIWFLIPRANSVHNQNQETDAFFSSGVTLEGGPDL